MYDSLKMPHEGFEYEQSEQFPFSSNDKDSINVKGNKRVTFGKVLAS